jgi:hypothetical protein
MKIELSNFYSSKYKAGYLLQNKEPRNLISLVDFNGKQTSMSYARYIMSSFLQRDLLKSEQVDHIDNNPLNDVIENLQIMTSKENNIKKNEFYNIKLADDITLTCPICNKIFSRPSRNIKNKLLLGKTPCCSRSCGGKFSHS